MYSGGVDAAERLIESTRVLLWERGYVGTSPKAIQAHAGVGQGSMYHHFAGKAALAHAAIARTAAELRAAADAQLGADGPVLARIEAYLPCVANGTCCAAARSAGSPRIPTSWPTPPCAARSSRRSPGCARLGALLAEGVAAGELTGLDPPATAATIVAVLQGGYVLARAAGSTEAFTQAVDGLLALLTAHAAPRG